MTNPYDTRPRSRFPTNLRQVAQAGALVLPALRYMPKSPVFLIGALVAGAWAWRNREKISGKARPFLDKAARLRRGDAGRSTVSDIY